MTDTSDAVDVAQLKELVPLFSLSEERLHELAALSAMSRIQPGVHLFHEGDVDNQSVYLLKGQIRLMAGEAASDALVASGTPEARHPLGDSQPRQVSAIAVSEALVLRIDNNVLDYMITWDQLANLEQPSEPVNSPSSDAQPDLTWMNKILKSLPFKNIPAANVRHLLQRMEAVPVGKGEVVVRQGEPGDYYYLIHEGQAKVTRQVELAELGEGASFGEEALVTEAPRNATVTMMSDGTVMRLSKDDFNELLKEPLLSWVSPTEARDLVNQGALWLDVRHAREFSYYRLPNAINLPLHELRQRLDELNRNTRYICYCKTGRRSSAAAFVLGQAGFEVRVLRGGLQVLPPFMRGG